jgi:hypothetical protein
VTYEFLAYRDRPKVLNSAVIIFITSSFHTPMNIQKIENTIIENSQQFFVNNKKFLNSWNTAEENGTLLENEEQLEFYAFSWKTVSEISYI